MNQSEGDGIITFHHDGEEYCLEKERDGAFALLGPNDRKMFLSKDAVSMVLRETALPARVKENRGQYARN